MRNVLVSASFVVAAACLNAHAQVPSFTVLENPPFAGDYVSGIEGVNADGSVAVGFTVNFGNGYYSLRWRQGIGFDRVAPGGAPAQPSIARDLSTDASVVCGDWGQLSTSNLQAWVQSGAGAGQFVGFPPGTNVSTLYGMSGDGNIATGYGVMLPYTNVNRYKAAYYDIPNAQWINLPFDPLSDLESKAIAANADGSVIVGSILNRGGQIRAFRWEALAGEDLVRLSNSNLEWTASFATGVSADGNTIVGYDNANGLVAWRWTAATGMVQLSDATPLSALGISPDGAVIVGTDQSSGASEPFVWDAAHGVQSLHAVLVNQGLGPAITGYTLETATAISQQGGVYSIGGYATTPTGYRVGWVARLETIPALCPTITSEPVEVSTCSGGFAYFSVAASGATPMTFQWRQNGTPIDPLVNPFAATKDLIFPGAYEADAGSYDCIVTNACGSTTSQAAILTIGGLGCCPADLDDGSGTGAIDGGVDINDLLYFLLQFEAGSAAADLDDGSGNGGPDGGVDINDLLFFLVHFEAGC